MIPEESLRQAAQRAQEALLDSLPESPAAHTFSPAYRRKLDRLARRTERMRFMRREEKRLAQHRPE